MPGLRERLRRGPVLLAPGICDGLTALLAARAGAEALYLSGAAIAYTRFGRPDLGLVGMTEVADTIAVVRDRVDLPLIVDGDTGFGNALNVARMVRHFERLGADAVQIEDQTFPKRCGHLRDKRLISVAEMAGKIRAACDARASGRLLIVARTDAVAVEGFDAALDRARAYAAAGADLLFVDALTSEAELARAAAALSPLAPVLANMVEGGRTPLRTAAELGAMGFSLVIFPGGAVRAAARLLSEYYGSLVAHGTTVPFRDRMFGFEALNEAVGTQDLLDLGRRYDGGEG